jgi:diguanylate cyclase (GGDEF)-like protein
MAGCQAGCRVNAEGLMSFKLVQRLFAIIVCCFLIAVGCISIVIFDRQAALQEVSRYNAAWTVSQATAEFLRLENALTSYAAPEGLVSYDEVVLRLDIMFSRLDTFEKGSAAEVGEGRSLRRFVRNDPKNEAAIRMLRERLDIVDGLMHSGGRNFNATKALQVLLPIDAEMTAMAARASSYGGERVAEDKDDLARLHLIFTGLAAGLILCGVILIVLLATQNRLLGKAHAKLGVTTAKLASTYDALSLQNQRFDAALNSMSQALCTCNAAGELVVFNQRFGELLGAAFAQPGANLQDVIRSGTGDPSSLLDALYQRQAPFIRGHRRGMFTLDLPGGRAFSVFHEPLADGGWLATYADVSERRQADAEMLHMAHHDGLTGLPNRVAMQRNLEERFAASYRTDEYVTVLLLDLDGFKEVNNTLGHDIGDEVLKEVASRLLGCVEQPECLARLGGDEFAFLTPAHFSVEQSYDLAEQILKAVSSPYSIGGRDFMIGTSIGIASEPPAACNPSALLRHADLAMYEAKALGKGMVAAFDPQIETRLQDRRALEADLKEAVVRGQMEVFYQPLLDTQTLVIQGYEALLRWRRGDGGYVSPADFIPVAEDTGLIDSLGEWVLRAACNEACRWPIDITVAVNLSPVQFRKGNIVQNVIQALSDSGLSPHRLELEITESVLLETNGSTVDTLHQLKQLGICIALDDFGTGYSSLSYLSRFTFDKIKIDRSFIQELAVPGVDTAVVELVVDLGKKLGIRTTAEGVENEAQLKRLQEIGCTQVQGFLFAKPRPTSELFHQTGKLTTRISRV